MQRVATDLFHALKQSSSVDVVPCVLHTSWSTTHRKMPGFLARAYRTLTRSRREQTVDAVLFSSMVTATLSVLLHKRFQAAGIPMCAIVHGLDVTTRFPPYQWLVRKTLSALDAVYPVSSATAAACIERGADPGKVEVIPNGISSDRFETTVDRFAARQGLAALLSLPSLDNVKILSSVGRQVKRKGFDWFIKEVLPSLDDDVHYVLAGDGPMADDIMQASMDSLVSDRVHILGRVPEEYLQTIYAGSDLYIMPNIHVPGDMEGFGVVMLEAGLSNLPVIAADIEGISDVIQNGSNGLLLESEDAQAFIETIKTLLADPNRLHALADTSRQTVLNNFNWSTVAARFVTAISTRCDRAA